jgi:hypothetical protein
LIAAPPSSERKIMKKALSLCPFLIALTLAFWAVMPTPDALAGSMCMTHPSTTNCDGLTPLGTGCSADAVDLVPPVGGSGFTVQLRYSPTCQSAWARTSTGKLEHIQACVARKDLTTNSPQCQVATGTVVFTSMLYLGRNTYYGKAGGGHYSGTETLTYTGWAYGY